MAEKRTSNIKFGKRSIIERSFNTFYLGDRNAEEIARIIGDLLGIQGATEAKLEAYHAESSANAARFDNAVAFFKSKLLTVEASVAAYADRTDAKLSAQEAAIRRDIEAANARLNLLDAERIRDKERLTQLVNDNFAVMQADLSAFRAELLEFQKDRAERNAAASVNRTVERLLEALLQEKEDKHSAAAAIEEQLLRLAGSHDLNYNARQQIQNWCNLLQSLDGGNLYAEYFLGIYSDTPTALYAVLRDFYDSADSAVRYGKIPESARVVMCEFLTKAAEQYVSRDPNFITIANDFIKWALPEQKGVVHIDKIATIDYYVKHGYFDTTKARKVFIVHHRGTYNLRGDVEYFERTLGENQCFYSERNINQGTGTVNNDFLEKYCLPAMDHCALVLALIAENTLYNPDCRAELQYAKDTHKLIIVYCPCGRARLPAAHQELLDDYLGTRKGVKYCPTKETALDAIRNELAKLSTAQRLGLTPTPTPIAKETPDAPRSHPTVNTPPTSTYATPILRPKPSKADLAKAAKQAAAKQREEAKAAEKQRQEQAKIEKKARKETLRQQQAAAKRQARLDKSELERPVLTHAEERAIRETCRQHFHRAVKPGEWILSILLLFLPAAFFLPAIFIPETGSLALNLGVFIPLTILHYGVAIAVSNVINHFIFENISGQYYKVRSFYNIDGCWRNPTAHEQKKQIIRRYYKKFLVPFIVLSVLLICTLGLGPLATAMMRAVTNLNCNTSNESDYAYAYIDSTKFDITYTLRVPDTYKDKAVTKIGLTFGSGPQFFYSKISLPASVDTITDAAFGPHPMLRTIEIRGDSVRYYVQDGCLIDRDTHTLVLGTYTATIPEDVTAIAPHAFDGCGMLTAITIPEGVTAIGDYAFRGCKRLTSITLPAGLTELGACAFEGCDRLTDFTLSEGNTSFSLRDGDLYSADGTTFMQLVAHHAATSFSVPEGVTTINPRAFANNTVLASISLPSSLTTIGNRAFMGCTAFKSIDVPEGATTIEYSAFFGCTSLTSVTLPSTLTTIGYRAFFGCSALPAITLPAGLTKIDYDAFRQCDNLTSFSVAEDNVTYSARDGDLYSADGTTFVQLAAHNTAATFAVPEGVTTLSANAFAYNSSLTSVTLPSSLTTIGRLAFYDCTALTSIDVPAGVTTIEYSAFSGCTALTAITLPEGVGSVPTYAFKGCTGLGTVTIPAGVTTIGTSAFEGCTGLTTVYFGGTEAQWSAVSVKLNNTALTKATIIYAQ